MDLAIPGEVDAAVCANDHTAAILLQSLERRGIRVPRNIRVVGFDDVRFAAVLSVPLTTIHQPCREIAATAFRAMLERIANPSIPPRSLTLFPRLVIRESCGAYMDAATGTSTGEAPAKDMLRP
jgi:LacI family transcriptional regulator